MSPHDSTRIRVIPSPLELPFDAGTFTAGKALAVVAHEGIAILFMILCSGEQADFREVFDVESHMQRDVAQHAVEVGESPQVPEVEVYVLAVPWAANMLGKELPVCVDAEELALCSQVRLGLILGAKLEADSLCFHVGNLLINGEQRLGARLRELDFPVRRELASFLSLTEAPMTPAYASFTCPATSQPTLFPRIVRMGHVHLRSLRIIGYVDHLQTAYY